MKQYSVLSVAIAAALMVTCGKSPTGPGENAGTLLTLTTTASSSIATILRIPDKAAYKSGDTVKVLVTTNSGYTFTGWSGDTVTGADTLVLVMTTSKIIYANFKNGSGKTIFSVVTSAINGSIFLSPAGGIYDSGATVIANAWADYGYLFDKWTGCLTGKNALDAFVVVKNVSLTADFSPDPNAKFNTLTISPTPAHGKITVSPLGVTSGNGFKFKPGDTVMITAEPDPNYRLEAWGGDFSNADSSDTSLTAIMNVDRMVSATFSKKPVGAAWTKKTSGISSKLLAVVWTGSSSGSGGQLVAVGENGALCTSPDGETWTIRNSGTTTCLNAIVWTGHGPGAGQLAAVGNSGVVLTSPDGVIWTSRTSGITDNLQSIAWTGNRFVAVGGHIESTDFSSEGLSKVITSTDGVAWSDQGSCGDGIWYSLVWTGSRLFAIGFHYNMIVLTGTGRIGNYSSPVIYSSADGLAWTEESGIGVYDLDFRAIAWSGSKYVVVGRPTGAANTSYTPFITSSDGKTWDDGSWPSEIGFYGETWTGSEFVIVGDEGTVLVVTDNLERTYRSSGSASSLYGVTWTGNKLVAVGDYGTILTSP